MGDGHDREHATARPSARVLAVDPRQRVLLVEGRTRWGPPVWFTPGGALEAHETHADAAVREFWEETGFRLDGPGPEVWFREHVWRDSEGRWWRSQERFFLARVPHFEPAYQRLSEEERKTLGDMRWWRVDEVLARTHTFAPRRLGQLMLPLLRGELPKDPVDVGP